MGGEKQKKKKNWFSKSLACFIFSIFNPFFAGQGGRETIQFSFQNW